MSVLQPTSLATFDTEYCADSLEFCPFAEGNGKQKFLIGTYQLLKDGKIQDRDSEKDRELTSADAKRIGRIYVCDAVESDDGSMEIVEQQRTDTSAIFDIKWSYNRVAGQALAGVACADGALFIYKTNLESGSEFLQPLCNSSNTENAMCCSLDWSNRLVNTEVNTATSYSDGQVQLHQFAESQLTCTQQWHAHDAEAWITSFDYWAPTTVYSGGDDMQFKGWDIRMSTDSPTFVSRRHHQAGVCSIHSNFHRQHMLVTGSYDETVILWDDRAISRPLAEYNVGGGVWRLKWHPTNPTQLLVGAMYNGFHVLDVALDNGGISPVVSFMQHDSIAYGADWCQTNSLGKNWLVGTCSFYDHVAHLWRV